MNYELVKHLKDAGFPQNDCGNSKFIMPGDIIWQNETDGPYCINSNRKWNEDTYKEEDCAYFPTLSELIEVCGDKFYCLKRSQGVSRFIWMAESNDDEPIAWLGSTPEEAVANLWLALNDL